MTTFVLIHGASADSWCWHRVVPILHEAGYQVVAPDLPVGDDGAGLAEYAEVVTDAIEGCEDLILVGQSMGSYTAATVCQRVDTRLLILVGAMAPAPGESPGEWFAATGHSKAKRENDLRQGRAADQDGFDMEETFLHDLPADVKAQALERGERAQSSRPFSDPFPLAAWPQVPTRFLAFVDDRLFPVEFLTGLARDRLGVTPDVMPGGHLSALSRPDELAAYLITCAREALG